MNFKKNIVAGAVLMACITAGWPLSGIHADEIAEFAKPLNVEYERPDADYSLYTRLLIRDLDLSETKILPPPWLAEKPFRWDVSNENGDRLRAEFLASITRQVSGNGGFPVVNEPAEGVLELYVKIISFMPYAERKDKAVTRGSGEMIIHAETRDAQSGELIGIFEGPQEVGRDYQKNTDFTREKNVGKLFDAWGRRLRIVLDKDHGRE